MSIGSTPRLRHLRRDNLALALLLCLLAWASPPVAQEVAVPVELQFALFAKVYLFDRSLDRTGRTELACGILYQEKYRGSLLAKEAAAKVMESGVSIGNVRVRPVPLALAGEEELEERIASAPIDLLYVTPLRAVEIGKVAAICRQRKIRSLTGVPAYVEGNIAMGIGLLGDRPQILIDLDAARAEGADFQAQLLKIAKVYRRPRTGTAPTPESPPADR